MDSSAPDLSSLVYCSVANESLNRAEFQRMLARARPKNAKLGITGALMTDAPLIVQYLEGPRAAVEALWAQISADTRHGCVVKLRQENGLQGRTFGEWDMYQADRAELRGIVREAEAAYEQAQAHPWLGAVRALSFMLDQGVVPGRLSRPAPQPTNGAGQAPAAGAGGHRQSPPQPQPHPN
jgi:hypothetical protein